MPADFSSFISQLDEIIRYYQSCSQLLSGNDFEDPSNPEVITLLTRLRAAIHRLAPQGSEYRRQCAEILNRNPHWPRQTAQLLMGVITALRADYKSGYMQSIVELLHADLFSDFLEMAQHLLSEGYKDPAAVLAGSVLEEHLRKLCDKNGLSVIDANGKPLKADRLNADLKAANVYSALDQKQVTAWQELRNQAAHGHYSAYTKSEVDLMISGIQQFISRNPA